ncbi:PadR family transcriptional regulator [Microlunatus elymi]|uniref:PadR family transcriptional regulator n=1 Tax=Microlunatus elymi TaxID=2596828 RepID=A0A516Q2K5_9ACTN|nr:PadR family transcriptional regulator [Microlunatus elymi]QDP97665.1 PadR family transcriptional regulator [Microlunatus elymi]
MAELTTLAVSVLALLAERPMHPYEAYGVLMQRRADWLVKVRPGSLYHTVERLDRDGLVEATGTEREGGRPERTTYAITDDGYTALEQWVRKTLADPGREYPRFPVALAEAHNLPAQAVIELLTSYLQLIDSEIAVGEAATQQLRARPLQEAHWLEVDYLLALRRAERDWIANTIHRLQTKELPWPTPRRRP